MNSYESVVQELNKGKRVSEHELPQLIEYVDKLSANISNDERGATTAFRTTFIAVYMILFNMLRSVEKDLRKKTESASKISRLELAQAFDSCTSATVNGAVALFCLPKQIKRSDRFKIIASILSNKDNNFPIRDICQNWSIVGEKYKNITINWSLEIKDDATVNEYVRFTRVLMLLSDYTNDKAHAQFAKSINKHAYYSNVLYFKKKLKTFNPIMFEPLITSYIKFCVAPIDATKEYKRLNQQFEVNPQDVIGFIIEQLPISEVIYMHKHATVDSAQKPTNESKTTGKSASTSILSSAIQHYKPERIYDVYIGPANYQQYLELTNVATPQSIYHVAMVQHCLYDVFEKRDIMVKDPKNKSVMDLPWPQRLNLVDWRAKIVLKQMTGDELIKYRNTTSKSQAVTISCISDDGLSTTQTVIVKPADCKRKSSNTAEGDSMKKKIKQESH